MTDGEGTVGPGSSRDETAKGHPAVSRMGLGLAAVGRPAYITPHRADDLGDAAHRTVDALRARAHELLDEGWQAGIRYFDAARSYGEAEAFLGSWLASYPARRDELVIGSKWGYEYVGNWRIDAPVHERKEHSLAMLNRQWAETVKALGAAPDVYLIHSLTPESPALGDEALLDRLRELADGGVRVGFSTSGPLQGDVVMAGMALPDTPFTAVQATWNLLEPSAGVALDAASSAGWLVVLKEVLANGRLAPTGLHSVAMDLAAEDGQALDAFAIGAALAQPWADIVLSGAVSSRQLRQNLQARPPTIAPRRLDALRMDPDVYWGERSERTWT